jgi:GTP cyclohydrolase II
MNKQDKSNLRKEVRKQLVDELNELARVDNKNYKMKYNMLYDLGITEVDMLTIIDKVEDYYGIELSEYDILDTTDMTVFDTISHYNEKILKEILKNK